MDKSKIENLNPQEYTHLPHAAQDFEAHEQTDVAIRPLVAAIVSIAVVIVITGIGMWGLFRAFKYYTDNVSDNQNVSHVPPTTRQVPEGLPPLQGVPAAGADANSPAQDMSIMREQNAEKLAGLRPMRPGLPPGISIDQAMDQALERGMFKTAKVQKPQTQTAASK